MGSSLPTAGDSPLRGADDGRVDEEEDEEESEDDDVFILATDMLSSLRKKQSDSNRFI